METDRNLNAAPEDLKPDGAGRQLWTWLCGEFENIESCRPLAEELTRIADRLAEVRQKIAAQGLTVSAARGRSAKNPLLDMELKLSKQYTVLWRSLGLSDKAPDDTPVRPVGRPPAGEGKLWQG